MQPPFATARISVSAHIKDPKHWQAYHCLDIQKYQNALLGMGSTALAAAVVLSQVRQPDFSTLNK